MVKGSAPFMFKGGKNVDNKDMSIYLNNSIESWFIYDSDIELNGLDSFNQFVEGVVIFSLLGALLVGSYFKCGLYQYMYDSYTELIKKPIDMLILIQAVIHHLACLLNVTFLTIGLLFDITFSKYLGEASCSILWYTQAFGGIYRVFGSLGIAILRTCYIKSPYQVRDDNNRTKKMFITLLLCLTITSITTLAWGHGNGSASRKQVLWNFCTGQSETIREVVHNYSLLKGTVTPQSDLIAKIALLVVVVGVLSEFVCYIIFFQHVYSHDQGLLTRKVLSVGEVTKRHRQNAITFLGQFYGFVAECTTTFVLGYTMARNTNIGHRAAGAICMCVEFGILSVVEVMVSQGLWDKLPHNRHLKQ
jgi:hypothetical protein